MSTRRGVHFIQIATTVTGITLLFSMIPVAPASMKAKRGVASVASDASADADSNAAMPLDQARLLHAKELLGKYYKKSVVRTAEQISEVQKHVEQLTDRALKGRWNRMAGRVARAIVEESERYKFDPVFLMAVIENESSFNPDAVGAAGEIGLMQLLPATAKWIAGKCDLPWKGEKTLRDPVANIRIGAAYLNHLRGTFASDGRLYLAAYNMGTRNVRNALEKQIRPKDYPSRVMQRYVRLYSEIREDIETM